MAQDEVTLFAEPSAEALQLRQEIEEAGTAVFLVLWSGTPFVESRLATIRGYENIRRYFAQAPVP